MHVDFTGSWQETAAAYRASRDLPQDRLPSGVTAAAIGSLLAVREKARSAVDDAEGDGKLPGPSLEEAAKAAGVELPVLIERGKDATDLLDDLAKGVVSSSEVLEKALARAVLTDAALGCITEFAADAARARARELDQLREKGGKLGPLHGLPISIKAHVGLKGTGTDRGFVFDVLSPQSVDKLLAPGSAASAKFSPAVVRQLAAQGAHLSSEDAWIASTLQKAGAVIFAKTTMPQSVMQLDTRSNLHGQTLNPANLHLSPGGSSGGESALVGARAAAFGVGTDIGGSIRQPAACTGVYGIRPTTGRLSMQGIRGTMKGNEGILGTCGPFAHSLRDLQRIMSVLCADGETGSWLADSFACPPLPWRSVEVEKKLRVGVMAHDGVATPAAPVARSLEQVAQKLKASGEVEVVAYEPGKLHLEAWDLARELYFTEKGALIRALAESTGEPLLPLTAFILESPVRDHSASEMWELNARREAFKRQWLAYWRSLGIDVLLCPTSAGVAPRPGKIHYWGYTSFFNLVDHPGLVFPAGVRANSAQDGREPTSAPLSVIDGQHRAEYYGHQSAFDNAPVGLQLIGDRWKEEELLSAAATIERIIKSA